MNARSQITPNIFGTTNGFEIHTLTGVPLNVEDLAFAITGSEVELSDGDQCVKTFRLRVTSEVFTWIGLYRKAYEIGFSREGGYYGAGVWLAGITVDARLALDVLNNLADQVNALAIEGGRFQRPLSDIIDDMQIPPSLMPLKESSERYQRGGLLPDAVKGAYICQPESHCEIVDLAQSNVLFEKFRSMIVAPVASFPRGASSRLERYADLTEVVNELASDLSEKIAGLETGNLTLEKQAATLKRDLSAAQLNAEKFAQTAERTIEKFAKEAEQWERHCRKLERKILTYSDGGDGRSLSWLGYTAVSALIVGVLMIVVLFIFMAKTYWFPGTDDKTDNSAQKNGQVDGTQKQHSNPPLPYPLSLPSIYPPLPYPLSLPSFCSEPFLPCGPR